MPKNLEPQNHIRIQLLLWIISNISIFNYLESASKKYEMYVNYLAVAGQTKIVCWNPAHYNSNYQTSKSQLSNISKWTMRKTLFRLDTKKAKIDQAPELTGKIFKKWWGGFVCYLNIFNTFISKFIILPGGM